MVLSILQAVILHQLSCRGLPKKVTNEVQSWSRLFKRIKNTLKTRDEGNWCCFINKTLCWLWGRWVFHRYMAHSKICLPLLTPLHSMTFMTTVSASTFWPFPLRWRRRNWGFHISYGEIDIAKVLDCFFCCKSHIHIIHLACF